MLRSYSVIISGILFLSAVFYYPAKSQEIAGTPNLSGAKAVEYLKQPGKFDGLVEAVGPTSENAVQPIAAKITANDKEAGDLFGTSVAVSGNRVIIGAVYDDIGANSNQGSAYIFRLDGANWIQEAKLTAGDGAAGDFFGYSVDIDGDFAIVGAYGDDVGANQDQGSVYLYRFANSSWTLQAKITADDGAAEDWFGFSAAVSGTVFAVGAPNDDFGTITNKGSVYVIGFVGGTGWAVESKFSPPDVAANDLFGDSVDIFGGTIIAGSPGDEQNRGEAHIFERSGGNWTFRQKLTANDGAAGDKFGSWTAIRGGYLIVGAPEDDLGANADQGSAYTFRRESANWILFNKLLAADGAAGDKFGRCVGLTDSGFMVGAFGKDNGVNTDQGAAYIFSLGGVQKSKVTASDGAANDQFGFSVAADDTRFIAGALNDDSPPINSHGSAYVFTEKVKFDFDGDGRSDIGVFRPTSGVWHRLNSSNGQYAAAQFGMNGDKIVPSDYDGDGKTDIAVFRSSNGAWYWINSSNNTVGILQWGLGGDVPVPAFFRDGDGRADPTVFRPSNGTWYIYRSNGSGHTIIQWGLNGDIPVPADYFGEGLDNIAVFRPSNGTWYLRRSNGEMAAFAFGLNNDKPVPADYDGDGKINIAVFRPSNGVWYSLNTDGSSRAVQWGVSKDIPAAADYDGDGLANPAVFRPSNGIWYVLNLNGSFGSTVFGTNGDRPIPAAFVP